MALADRVAVITGAAGAVGTVAARRFHDAGARLVLVVRGDAEARRLKGEFRTTTLLVEQADLADATQVEAVVERAVSAFSRVDVLVNLVGVHRGGKPLAETAVEDFDLALESNLKAVFLMCRAVVPFMVGQRWGRIINVGARSGLHGRARAAAHAAAKAGVIALTEALAAEVRDAGVTANVLIPSVIDTPANRRAWPDADHGAWVPPAHLVETMVFLCSEEAQSITGARIPVFNRA